MQTTAIPTSQSPTFVGYRSTDRASTIESNDTNFSNISPDRGSVAAMPDRYFSTNLDNFPIG